MCAWCKSADAGASWSDKNCMRVAPVLRKQSRGVQMILAKQYINYY